MQIQESILRSQTRSYIRLLSAVIGCNHRQYSKRLERIITDFGCERSFAKAVASIQEHYGFTIPMSSACKITYKHTQRIASEQEKHVKTAMAVPPCGVDKLIAQADGSMVAIVQSSGKNKDRRKNRQIDYREARLCACRAQGKSQTHYTASFEDTQKTGLLWALCAKHAGRGMHTKVHVVCDGAPWIANQAQNYLKPYRQLLDFYHVCEYLNEAKPQRRPSQRGPGWMNTQKRRLQNNRYDLVLEELGKRVESNDIDDEQAPVRRAFRYLNNRTDKLDYQGAMAENLPIGSGMIESAHKQVIQSRLKIAGASWSINNAQSMIQTRAIRESGYWATCWKN